MGLAQDSLARERGFESSPGRRGCEFTVKLDFSVNVQVDLPFTDGG